METMLFLYWANTLLLVMFSAEWVTMTKRAEARYVHDVHCLPAGSVLSAGAHNSTKKLFKIKALDNTQLGN